MADDEMVQYSRRTNRMILTSDDDFLTESEVTDYGGLLFLVDETLGVGVISETVTAISAQMESEQIDGIHDLRSNWLEP